ncbi:MAG: tRNA epoxyqueuosine(34) reductase QueG [Sedimentisphaerales bacterium]|nr:tRNA epoxyqueuosine(34) reductase QueG [Sedimentisphaerales bacterium]
MSLSQDIKYKAMGLGFDLAGVTDASPVNARQTEIFAQWLKSGFAGQMAYMHRNIRKRLDPAMLLENAQSVIVVGLNYTLPGHEPKPADTAAATGRIAGYAQYEDYHSFIKEQLYKLLDFIKSLAGPGVKSKICVDSAPLAERAMAVRAGLGFVGKNHILINPELGCRIFLGEIVTDLKLPPDKPIAGDCAGCRKCLDACPTGALRPDGQFDAGRCINYLTIEYKGKIPPGQAGKIGDRLFGCETCLDVCPYQQKAPACKNKQFKFYHNRARIDLQEILDLDAEAFEAKFAESPIKRLGLEGLKRNARICLANITCSA